MKPIKREARPSCQRGVTLLELMIGLTIGLLVVAGLSLLFANSSRASRELEGTTRQIENGRYAVDLLSQELTVAGFYAEVDRSSAVYTTPDPCATALAALGWDTASKSRPTAIEGRTATELATVTCTTNALAGNPAFVLRRLDATPTPQASINNAAGNVYVQTSQCNADPANTPYIASNDQTALTLRDIACSAAGTGEVRRYFSRLYYVASCNECTGAATDTTPTLKRAELIGGAIVVTPLATGIEHLAVEYGFDTNQDGVPDVYRTTLSGTPGAADNSWSNVVTVRVYVLARGTDQSPDYTDTKTYALGLSGTLGPYNDHYKRKVFVTTAKLQNVAGPREN